MGPNKDKGAEDVSTNSSKEKDSKVTEMKISKENLTEEHVKQNIITVGTYIIGEDISKGKYNFHAIKGNGDVKIYNSYEDYKNDENGFNAFDDFDLLANGASRGFLNKDVCTDTINNIRLEDGQCLTVDSGLEFGQCLIVEDGLSIEYTVK